MAVAEIDWARWQDDRRREASKRRTRQRAMQVGFLVALAVGWEILGTILPPLFLPSLSSVLAALVDIIQSGALAEAVLESAPAFIVGFTLSLIVGNVAGLAMGRSRSAEDILSPWVAILIVTPVAAFVPLTIIFFGLGISARTAVVFLFSVPYVALNTAAGVRTVAPDLLEMSRSFGLGRWLRIRRIILPAALPLIVAGVRIAFPRALTGVILSELILSSVGVGFLLLTYGNFFATAKLFAVILVILAFAVIGGALISWVDRRVNRWQAMP
jgi:NitT/TauT family transport system permease protein